MGQLSLINSFKEGEIVIQVKQPSFSLSLHSYTVIAEPMRHHLFNLCIFQGENMDQSQFYQAERGRPTVMESGLINRSNKQV